MTAHERERAPTALEVDATLGAQLLALRQTYIQTARDQAAVMRQLWTTRDLVTRALHRLHRHAHALAGTAIMLGFAEVGMAAGVIEAAIERAGIEGDPNDWVLVAAVSAVLPQLEQAVRAMDAAPITWLGLGSASEQGKSLMQAVNALVLAGRSIVIVEDSGDVHYQLQLGLELAGAASALCCATLRQARAVLAPDLPVPEVVLIDHYLGRRTGAELAVWMQQQPHLQQTWRVSYSEASAEIIERSAGADAYHLIWRKRDLPELIAALAKLCATLPPAASAKGKVVMPVLQRIVAICLLGIPLVACSNASGSIPPTNNTSATSAVAASTAPATVTAVGSASPTPDSDAAVGASIQETLDRFATVYNDDKPELLKQVYDTSNAPLRRLFEDSYEFFRDPVGLGETLTTYRVTALRHLPHDFVLATIVRSRDDYVVEWPFREVGGRWVLAEPTKEQLGQRVKTEREGFTFVTYPWADDVNGRLMDMMIAARATVKDKLGELPSTSVEVRIQPTFGVGGPADPTNLAYYEPLPSGHDRVIIYTPQSLVSGFYDPQTGWEADYRHILTHEFTHFVVNRAFVPNIKLSEWMSEGIAEYVSEDVRSEQVRAALREDRVLPLLDQSSSGEKRDLEHLTALGAETNLGYALASELVAYIVEQHGGLEGFWKLCRAYADTGGKLDDALKASIGMSAEAFEQNWQAWLRQRYGS